MTDRLPAATPYRTVRLSDGAEAPYYVIPFDEDGRCQAPQTRAKVVETAGTFSDVFLFSHGWNNDWKVATNRYEHFINGFLGLRQRHGLAAPAGYKPVLVGVFWPSAVLVTEGEQAPQIAGGSSSASMDAAVSEERASIREIAARLPADTVDRFYALAQTETPTDAEALELARLLQPIYAGGTDEIAGAVTPSAEEILEAWKGGGQGAAEPEDFEDFGTATAPGAAGPEAAGLFSSVRDVVRNAIRGTTVWMMKDRAGVVGARGVGPLLTDLLGRSAARVHLIGHSFGGKVVLSALCAPAALPRKVHSVLLLQPAVSHLCFAENVPLRGTSGGYRSAPERVEKPIFSTFSKNDFPLTKTFHLGLVRPADLGEARIAAAGDPPNWFAALGGFGPRGAQEKLVDMVLPPRRYEIEPGVRIVGLRGDQTIGGHGDISNESTWWALYSQVEG